MKRILALVALMGLPGAVVAQQDDIVTTGSPHSVAETVEKLRSAIDGAGATVFAVVDHGAGAAAVGEDIGASQLVIFGNPAVGTPALLDNRQAGLFLPLKVLVYENEGGQVMVAYQNPEASFDDLAGIGDDDAYIGQMGMALNNLVTMATQE